jgi:serine/threonine/tyrosine-interacting protein
MFAMQHYQLTWEDALHLVQNRRYCISPNGGFLTQIKVLVAYYVRDWS